MREQQAQQLSPLKRRASAPSSQPVNPHHAGLHAGIHPEDLPEQTGPFALIDDDEDIGAASSYEQRLPSSTVRYHTSDQPASSLIRQGNRQLIVHYGRVPPRASANTRHSSPPRRRPRLHRLFYLGLGMFVMAVGWWLLTTVGTWWVNEQNTWRYGYPRISQTDAVVGHHDSAQHPTHFIALNLDGHLQVIEIPGGDATREHVYLGPTIVSANAAQVPVTLSFADVNGDGKLDLLLHVQGQTLVFLNTGNQFQPPRS